MLLIEGYWSSAEAEREFKAKQRTKEEPPPSILLVYALVYFFFKVSPNLLPGTHRNCSIRKRGAIPHITLHFIGSHLIDAQRTFIFFFCDLRLRVPTLCGNDYMFALCSCFIASPPLNNTNITPCPHILSLLQGKLK